MGEDGLEVSDLCFTCKYAHAYEIQKKSVVKKNEPTMILFCEHVKVYKLEAIPQTATMINEYGRNSSNSCAC